MKFQIIKTNTHKADAKPAYHWRLVADDGRFLARSRKYQSYTACKKDVHYVALSAVSVSLDSFLTEGDFELSDLISSDLLHETSLPAGVFEDL